jgi:DNA polymerase III sliding clamp (beta) subunit (PCNA family)
MSTETKETTPVEQSAVCKINTNVAPIAEVCAGDEQVRFGATTGVKVVIGEGKCVLQATDGRHAAVISQPDGTQGKEVSVIIPARLIRKLKDRDYRRFTDARLEIGGRESSIAVEEFKMSCPNVKGKFPDLSAVTPKVKPVATALVNARLLSELLEIAASIQSEESVATTLEIYDGGDGRTPMVAVRMTHEDQEFTGLLVQLVKSGSS